MKKKNTLGKIRLQFGLFNKIALIFIAMMVTLSVKATTYNVNGGGGNWTVGTSWTPTAPAGGPVAGDLVVISSGTITVNAASVCSGVTISGGTLTLNAGLTVNGPWVLNSGTFNPNTQTVTFGTGGSIGGSVATTFRNLKISTTNPTDVVSMLITGVHVTNSSGGGILTLDRGIFNIGTGNTLFMDGGGGGNTISNPNATGTSTIATTGTNGSDGGTITFTSGNPVTVSGPGQTALYNFNSNQGTPVTISNANALLINGTVTIKTTSSGLNFVGSNSPVYGPNSTLAIAWSSSNYTQGVEWSATSGYLIGTTAGYPNNVTITGLCCGQTSTMANNKNMNGVLTLGNGSGTGTANFGTNFSCGGVVINAGEKLNAPTGTLTVNGSWLRTGASAVYTHNNGTVAFGAGACGTPNTIAAPTAGSETFYNLSTVNNAYVSLSNPVTVSNTLTLTSGIITTSATNTLTVTNTATTAVSGGGASAYVNGALKWNVAAAAGTYAFPVGGGTCTPAYLPFTLNKPATSALTATVQGFASNSNGTGDVTVGQISATEYWSLGTSSALPTGGIVSVSRPTAIAPLAFLAENKTSPSSVYTSIAGTPTTFGVNNSNDIGTGTSFYFALASPPIVSTLAATSITTTSATLQGAFNTGGTSKTTSFQYGQTISYGTTVNTIHSPINSNTSKPDSVNITGLVANTIYHYKATDGTDDGGDIVFITAPNPPVVGAGNTPTATGFTATWSAPAAMGSAPYTYTIQVSSDPTFATGVSSFSSIPSGTTSYNITGLNPETQYYYRVQAVNATASSTWSATSTPISTLIVATPVGCLSGTGSSSDPGAIAKTLNPPTVDGSVDAQWASVPANYVSNVSVGSGSNTGSTWKAMWTVDTLYFLIQVVDPVLISQYNANPANSVAVPGASPSNSTNYYESDGVEITLDPDYSHGAVYDGLNDVQFRFNLGGVKASGQSCGCATQYSGTLFNNVYNRINFRVVPGGSGYIVEAAIPWGHDASNPGINLIANPSTYGTAGINQNLGVEVQINDATNTSVRSAQYSWFNNSSAPYQDPRQFAKAALYACSTPPTVINPKVTNITANGATLGATVTNSGDSPLAAAGTGYTAAPTKIAAENAAPVSPSASVGTPYSGPQRTTMTPQTKYYYKGYATNTNGGTGVSPIDSFFTLSALPTVQPTLSGGGCSQMDLNWTAITFPPVSEATVSGYLLLRSDAPALPSTLEIKPRIDPTSITFASGTTLVKTISGGATLSTTDNSAVAGTTYNYVLVPYTYNGNINDSTYNYFTSGAARISATIGSGSLTAPTFDITQPDCITPTGKIVINPYNSNLTYSIDGGNTFLNQKTFTSIAPGTADSVVAKNSSGCRSAKVPFVIDPLPAAPATPTIAVTQQPTCTDPNGEITVTNWASGNGLTYSINNGNTYTSNNVFGNRTPGTTYTVIAKNSAGCTSTSASVTVDLVPAGPATPVASVTQQPTCKVQTGTITVNPWDNTLTYSIGNGFVAGPTFDELTPSTTYYLQAKDANGCKSNKLALTIGAVPCEPEPIFIPNLITPNGDGNNDRFAITSLPDGCKLQIVNRWGDNVYQTSSYDNLWAGANVSDGIYYYDLILPDGKQYKGWLNIIR